MTDEKWYNAIELFYVDTRRGQRRRWSLFCVVSLVRMAVVPMVPEYDWELHRDLIAMREKYGNHRRFYKSAAWRRLRQQVLEEFRFESQDELHASPARYVRATCVHHDRFVDKYPGWALSEWWVDDKGNVHRNLIPLSHDAHDARHGRCGARVKVGDSNPVTEEWW